MEVLLDVKYLEVAYEKDLPVIKSANIILQPETIYG